MSSQNTSEELLQNPFRKLELKVDLDFGDLNIDESDSKNLKLTNAESYKHNPLFFTKVNGAVVNQSKIEAFIKLDQLIDNKYYNGCFVL